MTSDNAKVMMSSFDGHGFEQMESAAAHEREGRRKYNAPKCHAIPLGNTASGASDSTDGSAFTFKNAS